MLGLWTALSFFLLQAGADPNEAEAGKVAESYLAALTGSGDDRARALLLGGVSMDAQIFTLETARILSREPPQREEGDLATALELMRELDKAGRHALTKLMNAQTTGDEMGFSELSQAEAQKLLAPTRERSQKFLKIFPVLAYLTRVGKEVYWHPKNPMRTLLTKAGNDGRYLIELHRFKVESLEGPRKVPRQWPLRVLRFRSGKIDTGLRVLPASDWSAD